ncbi:hypothetical protein PsorP6_002329 [Peronosclerospora sorghi]|uniref:Uncharacterized protein n=1 Tax=Peronosclerospora sorghi TaxID=230839 RepID=A0ACC0WRT2_9STRA|nr:hypothetical protein PsorP6_002329 [Peronosclerospora sorghi]
MVWGASAGSKKSKLVFMPPGRRTAVAFVEIVYDGALNDFLGELTWPANSPDLNPIENVWKLIKDAIQRRKTLLKNVNLMQQALKEAWKHIDEERLAALADSMPENIAAVIQNKGGYTRW